MMSCTDATYRSHTCFKIIEFFIIYGPLIYYVNSLPLLQNALFCEIPQQPEPEFGTC